MSISPISAARSFVWRHGRRDFLVHYEQFGAGKNILFLPALSTVSSRSEWYSAAAKLADDFAVTVVDWPGFGAQTHPRAVYDPELLVTFLAEFVSTQLRGSAAVVAAGHAAGYALLVAERGLVEWSRLVLAAPTWRGPLRTAMGEHPRGYALLRALVRAPGIGHALYHPNTDKRLLRLMFRGHVYANPASITPAFLAQKQIIARQRGARFGAVAFVTGALDPFPDRTACLEALRHSRAPVQLIFGESTPPRSRDEMIAMAAVVSRPPFVVRGALGLHEECASALVKPLRAFLSAA